MNHLASYERHVKNVHKGPKEICQSNEPPGHKSLMEKQVQSVLSSLNKNCNVESHNSFEGSNDSLIAIPDNSSDDKNEDQFEHDTDDQEIIDPMSVLKIQLGNFPDQTTSMSNIQNVYKCHSCDKKYNAKQSLVRHIKTVHEGKKYLCNICNREFKRGYLLDQHKKTIHNNVTVCKAEFTYHHLTSPLNAL